MHHPEKNMLDVHAIVFSFARVHRSELHVHDQIVNA